MSFSLKRRIGLLSLALGATLSLGVSSPAFAAIPPIAVPMTYDVAVTFEDVTFPGISDCLGSGSEGSVDEVAACNTADMNGTLSVRNATHPLTGNDYPFLTMHDALDQSYPVYQGQRYNIDNFQFCSSSSSISCMSRGGNGTRNSVFLTAVTGDVLRIESKLVDEDSLSDDDQICFASKEFTIKDGMMRRSAYTLHQEWNGDGSCNLRVHVSVQPRS
ncbi:hypothetical protein [Streptomyces sp. MS2.AVA.5]|uniref:Uncharacterized protein n=1 Tax=Streptomyces achmelvichensis TaxID=3134111 RepID=A0ACC6PLJ8_9ACTN